MVGESSCTGAILTARYCGVSVPRPAKFPQVEALLSCWICCTSCCCRRRCSLSLCVSANFTTKGEEQPWSSREVRHFRLNRRHAAEFKAYLPMQGNGCCKEFSKKKKKGGLGEGYHLCLQKQFWCPLHSNKKLTHRGKSAMHSLDQATFQKGRRITLQTENLCCAPRSWTDFTDKQTKERWRTLKM